MCACSTPTQVSWAPWKIPTAHAMKERGPKHGSVKLLLQHQLHPDETINKSLPFPPRGTKPLFLPILHHCPPMEEPGLSEPQRKKVGRAWRLLEAVAEARGLPRHCCLPRSLQKELGAPRFSPQRDAQTPPSSGAPYCPVPRPPTSLTLRDVLELQALVPSGPSEVEELAGPTQAPTVGLLVGQSPLQGAGRVVEEVDSQLQVGLPRRQRRAENSQLQPFASFVAHRCLQHTGVEAAE